MTAGLGAWYRTHHRAILSAAIAVMTAEAALKYGIAFRQLTVTPITMNGAMDLRFRYEEVSRWFAGRPVYPDLLTATYPPQTYAVLWPFLGWNTLAAARWLWAIVSAFSIAWMAVLVSRESRTDDRYERAYVVVMWLSMNALGVAVGLGQLVTMVLPALTAGLLLLKRARRSWTIDVAVASLFQIALTKPTLALPFVWVAMIAARRARPLVLTAAGYGLLTLLAVHFQPTPAATLAAQWVTQVQILSGDGYGNLKAGLAALGLESLAAPAAVMALAGLGLWTYRWRRGEFWILVGVAALVARLWTYHRVYDDVVTVLAMLALFRVAKQSEPSDRGVAAGLLVVAATVVMLAPARLELAPHPLDWLFVAGHVGVWLAMLLVLARAIHWRSATA